MLKNFDVSSRRGSKITKNISRDFEMVPYNWTCSVLAPKLLFVETHGGARLTHDWSKTKKISSRTNAQTR